MEENEIRTEELKLSDKLAVQRTVLAADRTILAWVRTSLSLIGFGFTIYKVLDFIQKQDATKLMREETPRNIGIFMLVTGTVPLLFMIIQYSRTLKQMGRKESILKNANFLTACIIFLLGLLLLLTVLTNFVFL
jgi:putative membrane protein